MLHSLILLQEKIQDKITDEALTRGAEEAQRHAAQAGETLKTTGHELAQRAGDVDSHINFVVSFSQDPERWPVAVGLLVIGVFALLFGQKYIKWVIMLAGAVSGFLMGHMGVKQVVALSQRVDFLREMVYEKVEEPARAGDIVFATLLFPRAGAEPRREEGVVLAVSSPKWHGVALGAAPTPSAPDAGGAAQPKEKEAVKPVAAKPEAAPGKPDEKPKDEAAAAKPAEKLPLEGLAAGQFVEMTATFTADHEDKDLAGKSGSLRVSVEEVQRLSSGGLGGALAWMAERNLVIGLIMAAFCMLMAWPYAKFGLFLLGAAAGVMLANNLMGSAMDANMTLMGTIIGGLGLGLLSLWTMSIILILVTSVAGASMITVSLLFMITRMGVSAGDGRVWNADYLLNQWQLAVLIFSGLLALVGLYVQFFKTKKKPKPAV